MINIEPDDRVRALASRCRQVPFTRTALLGALEPWREVGVWTDEGRIHDNLLTRIRQDGRKIHPTFLFQVKAPRESRGAWDYYNLVATNPAEEAFRPMAEGNCPLVRG